MPEKSVNFSKGGFLFVKLIWIHVLTFHLLFRASQPLPCPTRLSQLDLWSKSAYGIQMGNRGFESPSSRLVPVLSFWRLTPLRTFQDPQFGHSPKLPDPSNSQL